jgi:hypothetical protein
VLEVEEDATLNLQPTISSCCSSKRRKEKKNEIKSLLAFCLGCDSVKHRRSRRTQAEVYICVCEKEKKKDDESQP